MGLLDFLMGSNEQKPKIDPLTGQTIVPMANPVEQKVVPVVQEKPPINIPTNTPAGLMQTMLTVPEAYAGPVEEAPPEIQAEANQYYSDKIINLEKRKKFLEDKGTEMPIIQGVEQEIQRSQEMVDQTTPIETPIETSDDDANNVKKSVGEMTPKKRIEVEQGLLIENTAENLAEAKRIADAAASQLKEGGTMSDVVEGAKGMFGDLFTSKAFQRAFLYYLGSRMMGYSAGGSGMAAGQLLMQGWAQEDKTAEAKAKADQEKSEAKAKADQEKAEADAIDKTKTVNFVDGYGRFREGFTSKSGRFHDLKTGMTFESPQAAGLRPAMSDEKTHDEKMIDAYSQVRGDADNVLGSIRAQKATESNPKGYPAHNVAAAESIFRDAGIADQVTQAVGDSWGVDSLGKPATRNFINSTLQRYATEVAAGGIDEVTTASALGYLDRAMLTASRSGVPKDIYTVGGEMASSDSLNALSSKARNMTTGVQITIQNIYNNPELTEDEKAKSITALSQLDLGGVTKRLNRLFKEQMSKSKADQEYWKDRAKDNGTTPFIAWYTSSTSKDKEYNSFDALNITTKKLLQIKL